MDEESVGGDLDSGEHDLAARGKMRQFYQKLDKTQEWAENNYWHLPIEQQGADLVTVNPFWRDYAAYRRQGPFLSPNLAYASRNFTEMMFALSVLDLPFEAEKPQVSFEGARMKLTGKATSVANVVGTRRAWVRAGTTQLRSSPPMTVIPNADTPVPWSP